ncbi:MAG TPA: hypothetical protein PLA50_02665, partial [Bacteroidia bacterium]|nr:hypothetical protein [Bacteroidia bacterium]
DEKGRERRTEVDAMHCSLVTDYERIGQARGVSCLYHAINRLLDRGEILAATTKGIKLSQQIGYAIESKLEAAGPAGGPGSLSPRPQKKIDTPAGPVSLEKFLASGQVAREFLDLPAQRPVRLAKGQVHVAGDLLAQRRVAHLEGLVRDISIGTGFFPEALWNVSALGGANTRFVMAGTQSRIEELQEILVETYCAPLYLAYIADAIEKGELDFHPEWFLHTWLTPARLTVDFGRDGKLHLEQYKQGHITLRTLYGYRGEDWRVETDDYLDERAYMKAGAAKRGLTMQEAYPQFFGPNTGAAATAPIEDDDEDEDPDDDPKNDE